MANPMNVGFGSQAVLAGVKPQRRLISKKRTSAKARLADKLPPRHAARI